MAAMLSSAVISLAVGMALASKAKERQYHLLFFGEGAAAEGEFHEAMNLAALWEVPVLFVCENNLYAMERRLDTPFSDPN
jgi:pyruvate dehydrogenase E1 component alpha subunit/2-oxoisovalerate dehydrogenase E1 component